MVTLFASVSLSLSDWFGKESKTLNMFAVALNAFVHVCSLIV